jgi:hypothetical protein
MEKPSFTPLDEINPDGWEVYPNKRITAKKKAPLAPYRGFEEYLDR